MRACPTPTKCFAPEGAPLKRAKHFSTLVMPVPKRRVSVGKTFAFPENDLMSPSFPYDLMEKQMREMDRVEREMDSTFERMAKETQEMAKQVETQRGNVRVETKEEKFSNGYSYSRTVVISNDDSYRLASAPAQGFSIGTVGLLMGILAGVLTYLFNRGFEVTTFRKEKKWLLLLFWPVLFLFNSSFRKQVKAAVKSGANSLLD
ncbi:hypothetical protein BSKO_10304 [Bryopsis sp. KO-2023]|nr:hypothetical protein BSKO_10304 [Bryopsis sp. KO-2023]